MSFVNSYRYASSGFSFGNCLLFDGVDDRVDWTTTLVTSGDWTASFWCKFNAFGSDYIMYGSGGSNIQLRGASQIRVRRPSANMTFNFPTMSTGIWYHFMFAEVSGTLRGYRNGVESTSGGSSMASENMTFFRWSSSSNGLDGYLDDGAIKLGYGGTITDAVNLYNSGNGADFDAIIGSSNLYHHFDESGTATTAADSSGNGNNGALVNFPSSGMWVPH